MAKLNSFTDLRNYCLKSLGAPVIDIELDEGQIKDRIQDAIEYFVERHYDGTEQTVYVHKVTTAEAASQYITIPENIQAIVDVQLGQGNITSGGSTVAGFGTLVPTFTTEQIFASAQTGSFSGYFLTKSYYSMIQDMFQPHANYVYTPATHRMSLIGTTLYEGQMISIEGYKTVDAENFVDIYNERFIKKLSTAYIKKQWGINTKKYANVQLAGGITMNGQLIYDEAVQEIDKLEEDFEERYEMQCPLMIG